jgi:hypothetical protein
VAPAREKEGARLAAGDPQVLVEGLPGLLGQFEPDRTSGFPLSDAGVSDRNAVRGNILDFDADHVAAAELARLNMARSLARPSTLSFERIDQTCLRSNGGLAPINFPLFHGARRAVWSYVLSRLSMVILLS